MHKIQIADNHSHILKKYYENPLEELKSLTETDLEYVLSVGLDYDSNNELLELKKQFKSNFLRIGLGLHPEEIIQLGKYVNHELSRIEAQIRSNINEIDYIGEIGIDLYYSNSKGTKKEQIYAFTEMCRLAIEYQKPISIHARNSFEEIMQVIESLKFNPNRFNGFVHCFTGNFEQGMFFIERGFKLGISGVITYKSGEKLRNTVKELLKFYSNKEFNDIFGLETDSPYLSPEPIRSEKNSPRNIKLIAEFIENFLIREQ